MITIWSTLPDSHASLRKHTVSRPARRHASQARDRPAPVTCAGTLPVQAASLPYPEGNPAWQMRKFCPAVTPGRKSSRIPPAKVHDQARRRQSHSETTTSRPSRAIIRQPRPGGRERPIVCVSDRGGRPAPAGTR